MEYTISEELINKILNYIGTKPYIEVFMLINEIKQLASQKEDCKCGCAKDAESVVGENQM